MRSLLLVSIWVIGFSFGPAVLAQDDSGAVKHLWHITHQYRPQPDSGSVIPRLPYDTAWELYIEHAIEEDPVESLEPLLLIMLRLYRAQLLCCNQSYDIANEGAPGRRSPVTIAFLRLTGTAPPDRTIEFLSSAVGYEYYLLHKESVRSSPLRDEAKLIDKELRRISHGI